MWTDISGIRCWSDRERAGLIAQLPEIGNNTRKVFQVLNIICTNIIYTMGSNIYSAILTVQKLKYL